MNVLQPGLQYYVDKIKQGIPFSFVRYGDGEWSAAILHDRPRTGSGSQDLTNSILQRDMRRSLLGRLEDNYYMSLRPGSLQKHLAIERWLKRNVHPAIRWHDCRVFSHASMKGELYPLVKALRELSVPLVLVGPSWLERLQDVFPKGLHIIVRDIDCYNDKSTIRLQILGLPRPAVISFSAGPLTKILIYELFPIIGRKSTMLDCGSVWDVFCSVRARHYQRKMKPNILRRNLTGK